MGLFLHMDHDSLKKKICALNTFSNSRFHVVIYNDVAIPEQPINVGENVSVITFDNKYHAGYTNLIKIIVR